MKRFFEYIVAGLSGGLTVALVVFLVFPHQTIIYENAPDSVLVSGKPAVVSATTDFVYASEIATPAVVHIFAEQSRELAMQEAEQNRLNRRRGFFNFDDFFGGDFGGRNFYNPKHGSGSGVLISSDGYIVTNSHVVEFADIITITTDDGRDFLAEKIGTDKSTDLALLKIEGEVFPFLETGNSDELRVGEWVLAVGNPFSYLKSTVTAGIVSAKGRDLNLIKGEKTIEEFIQTDAAINPGNSGGALVNTQGKLVGINTAIATPTGVFAGYSFAIPANVVKEVVRDIMESGGDVERISLGIAGFDVDEELKAELKLKVNSGFYIDDIDHRSAAKFSGLLPGDVITKIEDKPIHNFSDIKEALKYAKKGDVLNIEVSRGGKKVKIPTQLRRVSN
jgi:serine protease Do